MSTQRRRRLLLASAAPAPAPPSEAPNLVIDGQWFRHADGRRWTGIQTSEFSLFKRYLEHEDVRPLLMDRALLGFNDLRVWILNESVVGKVYPGGIHPNQYHDFYDQLRRFLQLCGDYGFAVEVTTFTSCIPMMPDRDDQVRHWERTQEAARGLGNVRLELVNEYNWGNGENAPDRSLWDMRPVGIIASSGSSTADAPPPEPVWDYILYHSNGHPQWQRQTGHNTMEWADHYRVPGGGNENTRYPDDEQSTLHAYDAAAGGALLCASYCFHSQGGKYSRPFDAIERAAAEAWVAGAKSVPLEFQAGAYRHHEELESFKPCPACGATGQVNGAECGECKGTKKVPDPGTPENPGILRAYTRTLKDGRSHLVLIHY